MKMPTEAQMAAWERHVQESKRRAAARAKLPKAGAKKQDMIEEDEEYVLTGQEDDDYVVV